MNSYRIPAEMREHIRNINVRHDASGRYPQTASDYPEEESVLTEARKPLDDLHAFLWNIDSESNGDGSDHMSDRMSDHPSERLFAGISDEEEETRMDLDPSG